MEAKELMIGDWVYNTHNRQNEQVAEIGSGLVMLAYNDLYEYDEIEPIPITKEILEKNGFKEDDDGVYGDSNSYFIPTYQSGFDIGTWETHIEPTEGIGDFSGNLKYVHQLQHALKLCGIKKEIVL